MLPQRQPENCEQHRQGRQDRQDGLHIFKNRTREKMRCLPWPRRTTLCSGEAARPRIPQVSGSFKAGEALPVRLRSQATDSLRPPSVHAIFHGWEKEIIPR